MDTVLASIIVFGVLIFFHELGHFMVAKMVGIKVLEFSLGFGPKLISIPSKETEYNLRVFPLGGFVRMAGMDPDESEEEDDRGFNRKSVMERISVIAAGPIMNFLLTILLLAFIFTTHGLPELTTVVQEVIEGRPAALAGIRAGDRIVEINNNRMETWDDLKRTVAANPDRELKIIIERDQERISYKVVPYRDDKGQGLIGIQPTQKKVGPLMALVAGTKYTVRMCYQIMDYLGKGITRQAPLELGGPVIIVATINDAVRSTSWLVNLVSLSAFLSVSLGLFNLFPIPALDGSRIVFLVLEKLRGRPVEPKKENFIHMIGFGLLIMLIVVITYNDILRLIM